MEQLNKDLPIVMEEKNLVAVNSIVKHVDSPLLQKVRQNFEIFGMISLIFGIAFAFFFYKAGNGLNSFLFILVVILLLNAIMNKLSIPIKRATVACYIASVLLGLSSMLTSNETLQFLNIIAVLLLLDISLLHQFHEDNKWDFPGYLSRIVGLVFKSIASIGMPFTDSLQFLKHTRLFRNDKFRNIMIGLVITFPLLWAIVALLSSADLLFGKIAQQIYKYLFSNNIIYVVIMVLFGFLSCYCIICGTLDKTNTGVGQKLRNKADPSIAVTAMTLICLVYVLFCGIQVIYLFADGLLVLPNEFTFSEYARRGFFELLAVTVINIVLMLICTNLFGESKILRYILTCMTVCTYIMIASATYRMLLYIGAYNLTFLRLFVLLFLCIDAFVLAGVIVSVYNKNIQLFGYCVGVVTIFYLLFSFAKPDYFIALYHVHYEEELNLEDIQFLTNLSYDAASIVVPLLSDPDNWSATDLKNDQDDIFDYTMRDPSQFSVEDYFKEIVLAQKERGIRDFNLSYYLASRNVNSLK